MSFVIPIAVDGLFNPIALAADTALTAFYIFACPVGLAAGEVTLLDPLFDLVYSPDLLVSFLRVGTGRDGGALAVSGAGLGLSLALVLAVDGLFDETPGFFKLSTRPLRALISSDMIPIYCDTCS